MSTEFENSKDGIVSPRPTRKVSIGVLILVLVAVAVTVGLVVSGNNKKERDQAAASSSSSVSNSGIAPFPPPTFSPTKPAVITPSPSSPTDSPTMVPIGSLEVTEAPSMVTTAATPLTNPPTSSATATTIAPTSLSSTWSNPGETISGTTRNGMAFLRCANPTNNKQIVLLHGASFSKETWESHDMISKFCDGAQIVVALDFPVSTNYQGLMQVLDDLRVGDGMEPALISKPVTLVSPSASGYAMVSWIMSGTDLSVIPSYISEWVPVATGSLVSASDEQISALQTLPNFRVLAINGNDDSAGGKYSARLADLANATAVALVGRHAVYLQSPDDFVQTILDF
ncbi:hypothetical protein IV203_035603 [Nitzschia inconspicua]|uniref:Alpha/beta hydrolase n=1 Tax=Nitzschia inconspicua TaxID=303405 RepID=A0A9K3LF00_9STRA|nr:hypothetical protein IV203_035603 [Nitzschia inconspicua]